MYKEMEIQRHGRKVIEQSIMDVVMEIQDVTAEEVKVYNDNKNSDDSSIYN